MRHRRANLVFLAFAIAFAIAEPVAIPCRDVLIRETGDALAENYPVAFPAQETEEPSFAADNRVSSPRKAASVSRAVCGTAERV